MLTGLQFDCGRSDFSPPEAVGAAFATDTAHFPWLVSIFDASEYASRYVCAGSIISDRWILTAASCANAPLKARSAVLNVDTDKPRVEVDIVRIETHPLYNRDDGASYDMALLEVSSPIPLNKGLRPICLPGLHQAFEVTSGETIVAAGWGSPNETFAFDSPLRLKWAKTTVIDVAACRQEYAQIPRSSHFFRSETFCTKSDLLPAPFRCAINTGDSGTPLVMSAVNNAGVRRWYVAGMVSAGVTGCPSSHPDINVGLKQSVEWILSVISLLK